MRDTERATHAHKRLRKDISMSRKFWAYTIAALCMTFLSACSRSDTDMTEAYWCASYGTCKPSMEQAYQPKQLQAYDACAFYGICDRGS